MSLPLGHHRAAADRQLVPLASGTVQLLIAAAFVYFGVEATLFGRRDVAVVYLLSAIPLAMLMRRCLGNRTRFRFGACAIAGSMVLWLGLSNGPSQPVADALSLWILRPVVAVCVMMVLALQLPPVIAGDAGKDSSRRQVIFELLFGLLVIGVVPIIYVAARCRHEAIVVDDLVSQSRFGEAQIKIREVCRLSPSMTWKSRSVTEVARELDRRVDDFESQIAATSATSMDAQVRLDRCRKLAMLGRIEVALTELATLAESNVRALACELAGSIHENAGRFEDAIKYHQLAMQSWQSENPSPQRDAGLIQSALRLAYCERKLGNIEVAENHYLEVLAVSPTAENHFLVAQFYEDMQQAGRAHFHARRAMALDPYRYDREGRKLIDKLTLGHFGCLQVFREEQMSRNAAPSGGVPQNTARSLTK